MKKVIFSVLSLMSAVLVTAQTNPTPQSLPYTQNFGSATFTTMPTGMAAWNGLNGGTITSQALAEASAPTGDASITALTAATTTTGGVFGHMPTPSTDARVYVQSSTNATNGVNQIALAINTGSFNAVNFQYDLILVNNGGGSSTREVGVVLQYRQGTSGSWTTVPGSSQVFNGSQAQNLIIPVNLSVTGLSTSSDYQFRWAVWRPGTGAGNSLGFGIDNINLTGQTLTIPTVSLSASASSGSEANASVITLTATSSSAVTANETVMLAVSGVGITSGDYTLSNTQITIPNGQSTGTVTFTIIDDNLRESLETAIVAINSVSAGLTIGSPSSVSIDIVDNDDAIVLSALNTPSALTTFDELDTTGTAQTNISRGIYFFEQGTNANTTYRANNGSLNTGDTYSYGLSASSDRALGSLTTATLAPVYLGAKLVNNTGTTVNTLEVTYIGEQWRLGSSGTIDSLRFELSTDATSLNTGTWTPYNSLKFVSPVTTGTAGALNGNDSPNRTLINNEITGFTAIPNGANVWIRWVDEDIASVGDHGLAIDSLTIIPKFVVCSEPNMDASNVQFSSPTGTSVTVSWTNGSGIGRILIGRQGAPVADPPVDGVTYTANAAFGTPGTALGSGFVLYNGSGNSVTVTGLTPGATYHFAVIEYSCNPADYRIANPALGSYTTPTTPAIFTNVTSLPAFATQVGVPTLPDSIQVSGQFLTNDIVITAPVQFQVSTNYSSGYAASINLVPVSGNVAPTWIYVRYNPGASGNHSGNVVHTSTGANTINVFVSGTATVAGTLPATYALCAGPYVFNEWAATEAAGTYPANMMFHRFNAQDPSLTASDTANYTGAYNATSGTRINGLGIDGIAFTNTGTAGNLGAAVVGLNTSGRSNILVDFTCGTVVQADQNRVYNIRLQYRVGNGAWTSVPGPVEYTSSGQTAGHTQTFTGIQLPAACDNQTAVYLRWFYYQASGTAGSRPRLKLDDITITSSPLLAPTSDAVAVVASETPSIPSTTTGAINTVADGVQVWQFTIRDGGASGDSDNLPTNISALTFTQGALNTVSDFSTTIGAAALFDGTVKLQDGIITANSISFSGLNQSIADDASKTYSIRITLATGGNVVDGSIIQLALNQNGVTIGNACNSSGVTNFAIGSDGTQNVISVTATQLVYTSVPTTVFLNQNFTVTVSARDANNNIDISPRAVTLSRGTPGTGALTSASGLGPQNMNNGVYTWNDVQYNTVETFQLVATDNSSTPLVVTTLINCIDPCAAPTVPASALTFSNVTGTSMTLSWTNGNGTNRIVVARQGAAVATAPVNGTTYTANSVFATTGTELGAGYVVYNGSANTFSLTGLQPGNSYFFAVYEYKCNPPQYITTNPATGMRTTPTGIESLEANKVNLKVYPNPATNGEVNLNKIVSVEVFDALGKVVLNETNTNKLNVQNLKPGLYFVKSSDGEVAKLMIK
jgi:hypothetical protein